MNSPSYTPVDLVGEKPYLPSYKNSFEETKEELLLIFIEYMGIGV